MYPPNYMPYRGSNARFPGSGSMQERGFSGRGAATGGIGEIMQQMMGPDAAGRVGHNPYGGGVEGPGPSRGNLGGMRGRPGKGKGLHGYYRFGAIPTGSNSEVIKPQYYDYSGAPEMADMIQNPWDPTTWDPNRDFLPGGRTPSEARQRGMGGRRHIQSRFRR